MSSGFSADEFKGKKIGAFIVREKIGQGGMAIVFRGESSVDGQEVAIKVMHPSLKAEPQFVKRIFREADIASKLKHENIVRVYSVERVNGLAALVMEFVKGRSLYLMERDKGPYPLKKAIPLFRGILKALAFAHSKKVIHRDLKPENVLIKRDGTPLLTDFGIAKPLEATKLTQTGQSLGTPYYMSPEQVRGESDIDYRSDVYSAGVLFYELVTGKVPFEGDDPVSISYGHVHTPPVLPSSLNPRLSTECDLFILKAMEKEKANRFSGIKDMLKALDNLEQGKPLGFDIKMKVKAVRNTSASGTYVFLLAVMALASVVLLGLLVFDETPEVKSAVSWLQQVTGEQLSEESSPFIGKLASHLSGSAYSKAIALLDAEEKNVMILQKERVAAAGLVYSSAEKLFVSGNIRQALELFKRSFVYDNSRADTSFQLAKLYLKLEKFPMAAKFFGQTMRLLNPEEASRFIIDNEDVYFSQLPKSELKTLGMDLYLVGRRLYYEKKHDQAIDILRKSLHYKSENTDVHRLLLELYREKGMNDKAAWHERQILGAGRL